MNKIPFYDWCYRLRRALIYFGYVNEFTKIDYESFRPLYENGLTHLEAIDADADAKHVVYSWAELVKIK